MKLLLGSLSLCAVILGCLACRCVNQSEKEQFCKADFVVKVKLLSGMQNATSNNWHAYYEVKVIRDYVRQGGVNLKNKDRIYTASEGSLCGFFIDFTGEATYYMTGSYDTATGVMRLSSCLSMIQKVADKKTSKKKATGLAALVYQYRKLCKKSYKQ